MIKENTCLVIGDINIDFNIKTSYYPPEGGETHAEESVFRLGGSGCSTALILQKLGLQTALAANLGDDLFAQFALDHIRSTGLDISMVKKNASHQTGFFMILVTGEAQRTMFGNRGANAAPIALDLVKDDVDQARHIHFSGYNLLGDDQAAAMIEVMRYSYEHDKTISLDPGTHTCKAVPQRVINALPFVDYFLPNNTEAHILSGHEKEDAQIAFLLHHGCKNVVLKRGDCGSRFTSTSQDIQVPAFSLEGQSVQDTTGAGDSFNAGFLYGLLNGKSAAVSLKMGNAAGYLMITAPGGPLDFLKRENLVQEIQSIAD
jgi:sugar/nucleoside kinase (ribokinase family)